MATNPGFLVKKNIITAFIIPLYLLSNAMADPVLISRPKPPTDIETSLIWYRAYDEEMVSALTRDLDQLLEGYRTPGQPDRGQNLVNCDYTHPPKENEVCNIDVNSWAPCSHENDYGYKNNTPCIFLSLDKIVGWQPEFYNEPNELPARMPEDLKTYIAMQKNLSTNYANQVWVSCSGENPVDVENIGPIRYIPQRGFPGYFFPFSNTTGNLSPMVAIQFEKPMKSIVIGVVCKIWAHNIQHNQSEKKGVVFFELLND